MAAKTMPPDAIDFDGSESAFVRPLNKRRRAASNNSRPDPVCSIQRRPGWLTVRLGRNRTAPRVASDGARRRSPQWTPEVLIVLPSLHWRAELGEL